MKYYILRDRTPVRVDDMLEWGQMFERMAERRVAEDFIEQPEHDPVRVSTVFLGIDHNWFDEGPPLLFESMVFGGPLDQEMYRYSTWNEAVQGHKLLTDEAVLEGQVAAWEVREMIAALAERSKQEA